MLGAKREVNKQEQMSSCSHVVGLGVDIYEADPQQQQAKGQTRSKKEEKAADQDIDIKGDQPARAAHTLQNSIRKRSQTAGSVQPITL